MIRICLSGIGKTGKEIARFLLTREDVRLVSAICSPDSGKQGKDLGEIIGIGNTGIIINNSSNLEQAIFETKPDVVIDFSKPDATVRNARVFAELKVNMVVGTTGFSGFALKRLFVLSRKYHAGIVYAPNITLGVNVLMLITNLVSSILNNYDFQVSEIHHKHKKDAPSGTALKIAGEIEKGLIASGKAPADVKVPITAIRAGGVIGKHEVMVIGEEDKIEISHEAFSRRAFAEGALNAARFIVGKTGYYEMSDVLNLKKVLTDYIENEGNKLSRRYKHYGIEPGNPHELWA